MHGGKAMVTAFNFVRALSVALRQALHVGVFRPLRLGRADRQPGVALAVEQQVQLNAPGKSSRRSREGVNRGR
jgi:hypothetical protein